MIGGRDGITLVDRAGIGCQFPSGYGRSFKVDLLRGLEASECQALGSGAAGCCWTHTFSDCYLTPKLKRMYWGMGNWECGQCCWMMVLVQGRGGQGRGPEAYTKRCYVMYVDL